LVRTRFPTRVQVLPETFDHYYVSMVLPPDSPLREPLNRAILKFMDTDKWQIFVKKYLG
jgi:ABC-type amino acid transport substrate-binding protein